MLKEKQYTPSLKSKRRSNNIMLIAIKQFCGYFVYRNQLKRSFCIDCDRPKLCLQIGLTPVIRTDLDEISQMGVEMGHFPGNFGCPPSRAAKIDLKKRTFSFVRETTHPLVIFSLCSLSPEDYRGTKI